MAASKLKNRFLPKVRCRTPRASGRGGFTLIETTLALALTAVGLIALLGLIGGLATPFVLDSDGGTVAGLVTYSCVVLAGAALVFARRGWHALVWCSAVGGGLVFALAPLLLVHFLIVAFGGTAGAGRSRERPADDSGP